MRPEDWPLPLAVLSVAVPAVLGLGMTAGRSRPIRSRLFGAFAGGALIAGGFYLLMLFHGALTAASRFSLDGAMLHAFVGAALPEETLKVLLLALVLHSLKAQFAKSSDTGADRRPGSDLTALHGLLAGLALGLGFATVENLVYAVEGGATNGAVRLITAVPCHAFLGAIMGHYLAAYLTTSPPRTFAVHALAAKAWLVPVLAHGLYNLPLVLDARAYPATAGGEDVLLSALVLAWLAAWTRFLLVRLVPRRRAATGQGR